MTDTGQVLETYVAAIQHDLVDLPAEAHHAGVVRRPTPWFHGAIDDNYPALGPPPDLLDETKEREEELKARGICDAEALNAAWDDVDFAERYRAHLDASDDAAAALETLTDRLAGGDVVLVCYEGDDKRCHRHILQDRLGESAE